MAFNLSKADPSASSSSKGKFNLSKTEVAGGENNPNSNEPKKGKSKLGLILLVLAIGVGAWFFFSKNSAKSDLVENPDTVVSADSKNADLPNNDASSTVDNNSSQDQKNSEVEASTAPASATPTKPSSSTVKSSEAKATASSTKNTTTASNSTNAAKLNSNSNTSSAVNFKNGSAELMDLNDSKISTILDKLKSNPNLEINVEGYASSEGDLEFNKNLSQKRADKYSSYLVSQGVPKNNIKSIGKGIDNPIASNDTEEGRAQNRRVEVIIK